MVKGGFPLAAAVLVAAASGAGCEGDDVEVDVFATLTPGAIRTVGALADLVATLDDTSTAEYVVDLQNGEITPAS